MAPSVKGRRLRKMLERIARDKKVDIQELRTTPEEVSAWIGMSGTTEETHELFDLNIEAKKRARLEQVTEQTNQALEDLARGRDISEHVANDLEAIILLRDRPVTVVQQDTYADLNGYWAYLNSKEARARLEPTLVSIGRVELPLRTDVPYGGTGFVVGPNLIMTNRHVAQAFTAGVGTRHLLYTTGGAAIDFKQEQPEETLMTRLEVEDVILVHPFWDMALLRVDGLPPERAPLKLSIRPPEELRDCDVVLVGYPAPDPRNGAEQQRRIFNDRFFVKRLQPGKVRERQRVESFGNIVPAMTHDASTLGGNSGSAIIEVSTGYVVGLHFGGVYLKINYGVPMFELARDSHVVDAGLSFLGRVATTDVWRSAWLRADGGEATLARSISVPQSQSIAPIFVATTTIPLNISVSLGGVAPGSNASTQSLPKSDSRGDGTEAMRVPVIYDDLEQRTGYQDEFLGGGTRIPMPHVTELGDQVVAKLDDGSFVLRYHRFSVVMHKRRRLALFTAANVDWRVRQRLVRGKKPTRRQLTGLGENDQEKWVTDPRIPDLHQLPDVFYTKDNGSFDKGHLVRRDDVAWGDSFEDIQMGNGDTYHTTNCSPQIAAFNRSAKGEYNNWGDLENLIQAQTKAEKAIIFAGPVLDPEDHFFHGRDERGRVSIQVPTRFWKIIVTKDKKGPPKAFGFLLVQDLSAIPTHDEMSVPPEWERYRASIVDIEALLNGWAKLDTLKSFDQVDSAEAASIAYQL